jgi:hypothetical protein
VTVPLWVSILVAVLAGIFGGIVGPTVTDRLSRARWKSQKAFELKYEAFQSATKAIAAWEADALDFALQKHKPTYNDSTPVVAKRETTIQALSHAESLIDALFSAAVGKTFDAMLKSHVSIDNVPNTEFENCRKAFVVAAALEMGLLDDNNAA